MKTSQLERYSAGEPRNSLLVLNVPFPEEVENCRLDSTCFSVLGHVATDVRTGQLVCQAKRGSAADSHDFDGVEGAPSLMSGRDDLAECSLSQELVDLVCGRGEV